MFVMLMCYCAGRKPRTRHRLHDDDDGTDYDLVIMTMRRKGQVKSLARRWLVTACAVGG